MKRFEFALECIVAFGAFAIAGAACLFHLIGWALS